MRRFHARWILPAAVVAAASFLSSPESAGQATLEPAGLPGARPVIEAADYPSLQAALDAIPDEGGMVRMPPGRFEIEVPLRIEQGDVLLVGSGTATHIVNRNTDGEPAILIRSPKQADDPRAALWRIHLADFRITGNESSGHGIHARAINEIFVHGVTVSEHGGDGILLDACYEDPRICDSLLTYNKGTGLDLQGCHDIVVSGNQFEENQDALHCFDGFNLCMTGNNLDDHLGDGVVIENTYGSVVSGNMIEECQGTAIVLDRDCYGITLSANVIAHDATGGIDLRDAHGCAVSANTFTLMGGWALAVRADSGRITVTGNNFSNSYIGEGEVRRQANDRTAAGMLLDGTRDVSISGNVFASLSTEAIALGPTPSRRVMIDGNLFVDVESSHARLRDGSYHGDILPPETTDANERR